MQNIGKHNINCSLFLVNNVIFFEKFLFRIFYVFLSHLCLIISLQTHIKAVEINLNLLHYPLL